MKMKYYLPLVLLTLFSCNKDEPSIPEDFISARFAPHNFTDLTDTSLEDVTLEDQSSAFLLKTYQVNSAGSFFIMDITLTKDNLEPNNIEFNIILESADANECRSYIESKGASLEDFEYELTDQYLEFSFDSELRCTTDELATRVVQVSGRLSR